MIGEVEHDGTIYFASEFQRSCAMATSFHVEKLVGENVTHIIYNISFSTFALVILIDLSVGTPFVAGLASTSFYFALALKVTILTQKKEKKRSIYNN